MRRTSAAISSASQMGGDGQRDQPAGMGAAPFLDVPVVVGLEQLEGDRLVLAGVEELSGRSRQGGEVQRSEHAADVHVVDPGVDVVAPGSDLLEGQRLDAVLLGNASRDGVEPEVGDGRPLEHPQVPALVGARSRAALVRRPASSRRPSNMSGGSTTWSSTLTRIRSSIFTRNLPGPVSDGDVRLVLDAHRASRRPKGGRATVADVARPTSPVARPSATTRRWAAGEPTRSDAS